MKVKDVMTPDAKAISINGNLAEAAREMWENDCGVLPIVKEDGKVVGMITDRDICMATAMRNEVPSRIPIGEVLNAVIFSAAPDDEVSDALKVMREHKVRRMPVLNADGELQGILSMNDIVLRAKGLNGKTPEIGYRDVVKTYQAICAHPVPMAKPATA